MTEMETTSIVGARLKKAREAKALTIDEVSIKTKIHRNVLEDLEADKLRKRLNDIYVRSFLKTYSDFLELNTPEILEEYFSVHKPQQAQPTQLRVGLQKLTSGWGENLQKAGKILMAAAAVCLVLYLAFTLSVKAVKTIVANVKNMHLPKRKVEKVVDTSAPAPQKSTPQKQSKPKQTAPVKTDGIFPIPKSEPLLLKITANKDCWMRVKVDGKTLFQGVLKAGDTEKWQGTDGFELWVGNAGGIDLQINNKALPAIGKSGEVKKGIIISHSGIQK